MLGGVVHAAVFEADDGVAAERHQVGQEEPVGGLDLVLLVLGLLGAARADGMAGEGQGHVLAAPIIAAAAPFLGAGAVGLRRLAVVEEEPRVAFQRVEHGPVGEDPRGADEMSGPIAAALGVARVEEDQVFAGLGIRVIAIGRVEVADVGGRISARLRSAAPSAGSSGVSAGVDQFDTAPNGRTAWGNSMRDEPASASKRMLTGKALTRYSRLSRL